MANLEVLPKRLDLLDVNDPNCQFRINIDVLNEAFGIGRSMFAKAAYPDKKNAYIMGDNEKDKYFIWLPKMYGKNSDWQNSINENGTMIYEVNNLSDKDWVDENKHDLNHLRIVFIQEKLKGPYRFVGVFKTSNIRHCNHTYVRIATKVKLVGNPVNKIILLDDIRRNDDIESILHGQGFIKQKVKIHASEFSKDGIIVYTVNQNGMSIVVSPDVQNIPSTFKYKEYTNSNLIKFPKHLNNGKKEEHYGIKVDFENEIQAKEFISWLITGVDIRDIPTNDEDWSNYSDKITQSIDDKNLVGQDKIAVTKQRVNQGIFRTRLLEHDQSCLICGIKHVHLLVASHIKPWRDSEGNEKLDPENGLLLCPNHDKLFDQGLISFTDEGNIIVSNQLDETDRLLFGITDNISIEMSEKRIKYMQYHRKTVFIQD